MHLRGGEYIEPNVSLIVNSNEVKYNQYVRMTTYYIDGVKYECEEGTTWRYIAENNLLPENFHWYEYGDDIHFEISQDYACYGVLAYWNIKDESLNDILLDDVITDGIKVYALGDISFQIDGEEWKTINGFTFGQTLEWHRIVASNCESCYNCITTYDGIEKIQANYYSPDEFWCIGGGAGSGYITLTMSNGDYVKCDDVVQKDYNYTTIITTTN